MRKSVLVLSFVIVLFLSLFLGCISNENSQNDDNLPISEIDNSEDKEFLDWALSDCKGFEVLVDQLSYRFRFNDNPDPYASHMYNITSDRLDLYSNYSLLSPEVQEIKLQGLTVMSKFQYVAFLALRADSDFYEEMEDARYYLEDWENMICSHENVICD